MLSIVSQYSEDSGHIQRHFSDFSRNLFQVILLDSGAIASQAASCIGQINKRQGRSVFEEILRSWLHVLGCQSHFCDEI